MIARIDAHFGGNVLKGMLMDDSTIVSTVSPCFKFDLNDLMSEFKIPNRENFEIIVGQVAFESTFKLAFRSIARHMSLGALAFVGYISEQEIGWSVQAVFVSQLRSQLPTSNAVKPFDSWHSSFKAVGPRWT